ncbi:MAG: hypothetical protein ACJ75Z_05645 [Solirubrobacterales bacterium]
MIAPAITMLTPAITMITPAIMGIATAISLAKPSGRSQAINTPATIPTP